MATLLYNVTVKIDQDIEQEWLEWMHGVHIPDVMATDCFLKSKMLRLKYPTEDEGITYAIQYSCKNMRLLEEYHSKFAETLQKEHHEKFAGKYAAFRTILEEVPPPDQD